MSILVTSCLTKPIGGSDYMLQAYHDVPGRYATGRSGRYALPKNLKKVKIARERCSSPRYHADDARKRLHAKRTR